MIQCIPLPISITDDVELFFSGYLQALRHVWVMACESRLLLTRSVDRVVSCPVEVALKVSYDRVTIYRTFSSKKNI